MIRGIYFLLIIASCASVDQAAVEVITAEKLLELQHEGVLVFDIRTPDEYKSGHIPNVIHVNYFDKDFIDQMKKHNQNEAIVIHCASGGRSSKAAKKLIEAGFVRVYDYGGGFNDWSAKGLSIEK
ncbi:rhodanese-like domain-containing protein [Ekhidna sp.]|uniref:rhodanese-like domain-containing protein n=1 Tax=Ekhidna sp. TaxID=2608089 RepID=UPI003296929B